MTKVFDEIKHTVNGVIGSYLMNMEGEILSNNVPQLFSNELVNASKDLFQLVDIVKYERPIKSIHVKADQGYIHLSVTDNFILGTFASKHADESMLALVTEKAIMSINPEEFKSGSPEITTEKGTAESPAKSPEAVQSQSTGQTELEDKVRIALCQAVKGKIKIMYGDKMAEIKVSEAFEQVGASRDTRKKAELKAVFDILTCNVLAKMMGKDKAREFLDNLYQEHGLK